MKTNPGTVLLSLSAALAVLAPGAGCFPPLPAEEGVDTVDAMSLDTVGPLPCPASCPAATAPCRTNRCDALTGSCAEQNADDGTACDDGLACTAADQCVAGLCLSTPRPCDDGVQCTVDSCSEAAGGSRRV